MFRKKKIGIALSGGAARGLAHIGVLEVLDSLGVKISAVSGCSMGAIVGAFYSLGIDMQEIQDYIKKTDWRSFLLFSVIALSRQGIVNDRKVDEVLDRFIGKKTFDDCKIPFCCVAVDLLSGNKVVMDSGSIKEAVRASISVPGLFQPVCINNQMLVDGGVIEPLPTEAIKTLDCNFIIASSIVFAGENNKNSLDSLKYGAIDEDIKKFSIQAILDRTMNIMHNQMVGNYIKRANIAIEPKTGDFGFFDFTRGPQIIEAGRRAAIGKIPEINRKIKIK